MNWNLSDEERKGMFNHFLNVMNMNKSESDMEYFENKVENMKDAECTISSKVVYIETLSNQDLVKLYNEKQTFIKEYCKAVRDARSELEKIIDEVDERAEEENISVVEFYEKYEEK